MRRERSKASWLVLGFFLSSSALAYEVGTHAWMTNEAYLRSKLAQSGPGSLRERLGFDRLKNEFRFRLIACSRHDRRRLRGCDVKQQSTSLLLRQYRYGSGLFLPARSVLYLRADYPYGSRKSASASGLGWQHHSRKCNTGTRSRRCSARRFWAWWMVDAWRHSRRRLGAAVDGGP